MSPHRSGSLAYWHSGGGVESKSGSLTQRRALELFGFYADEALAGLDRRDGAAFVFCVRTSLEIASAIVAADAWRAASDIRPVRVSRESTALWLRKA